MFSKKRMLAIIISFLLLFNSFSGYVYASSFTKAAADKQSTVSNEAGIINNQSFDLSQDRQSSISYTKSTRQYIPVSSNVTLLSSRDTDNVSRDTIIIKDYLSSSRVIVDSGQARMIDQVQTLAYFPYGANIQDANSNTQKTAIPTESESAISSEARDPNTNSNQLQPITTNSNPSTGSGQANSNPSTGSGQANSTLRENSGQANSTLRENSGQANSTDRLFTSHRKLPNLSVYHAAARFYSPTLGQFIQPDTVEGPNRYAYVGNNPIMYSDPSGNQRIRSGAASKFFQDSLANALARFGVNINRSSRTTAQMIADTFKRFVKDERGNLLPSQSKSGSDIIPGTDPGNAYRGIGLLRRLTPSKTLSMSERILVRESLFSQIESGQSGFVLRTANEIVDDLIAQGMDETGAIVHTVSNIRGPGSLIPALRETEPSIKKAISRNWTSGLDLTADYCIYRNYMDCSPTALLARAIGSSRGIISGRLEFDFTHEMGKDGHAINIMIDRTGNINIFDILHMPNQRFSSLDEYIQAWNKLYPESQFIEWRPGFEYTPEFLIKKWQQTQLPRYSAEGMSP